MQPKPKRVVKEPEEPAFLGLKLKKSQTVKREIEKDEMEIVALIHHEFEQIPLDEQVLPSIFFLNFDFFSLIALFLKTLH